MVKNKREKNWENGGKKLCENGEKCPKIHKNFGSKMGKKTGFGIKIEMRQKFGAKTPKNGKMPQNWAKFG